MGKGRVCDTYMRSDIHAWYRQLPGSQQAFTSEIMSFYTVYERMLLSEAYFPKAGDTNWLVTEFINQLAADINMLDTLTPQHLRGFMEVWIIFLIGLSWQMS